MLIKKGSTEKALVMEIQKVVGVTADGQFGTGTEQAVVVWQKANGLTPDGVVGQKTLEKMEILDTDTTQQIITTSTGLKILKHHLPAGEYIQGPIKNDYVFIHHTAGWNNPFSVIDSWARDSRGKIATEFVVGGEKITNGDNKYDGQVLQAFPEGGQGWQLGKTGSSHMNRHSVGIEMCNFGYLKNGKTYVGTVPAASQIATLKEAFLGFLEWHKYSDAQIENTGKLLKFIADRDNIDLSVGLIAWIHKMGPTKAFGFNEDAYNGTVKGLLTHTNVRKDKFDCFPQQELVDMLVSL